MSNSRCSRWPLRAVVLRFTQVFLFLGAPGLVGCAETPTFGVRAKDLPPPPVEPGVAWHEDVFSGAGGLPLYGRGYRPSEGETRGAVIFMNGLKDHGDRYAAISQQLVKHGYAAYAFDMRGHGRSAGQRVGVARFDDYLDDLSIFVARVRAQEPNKPIFVFGHSLGGAIVALYAIERHPDVAGVIVSSPAAAFTDPPLAAALVRVADAVAPNAPAVAPPNPGFSRDPRVVADMDHDPLIFQDPGPAHTAAQIIDGVHRIWAHPEQLTVPLLSLHGTGDTLTAPSGSRDLVTRAGSRDKTLRLYPGFAHDLVHEPGHERVLADIVTWLDAHTSTPPAAVGAEPAGGAEPPRAPGGAGSAVVASLVSDARPNTDADTLPLVGDRSPRSTSVMIDGRAEHAFVGQGAGVAATGGVRVRQSFGRIGWRGGVDLRAGSEAGFRWEADAHPLGIGARFGRAELGLTGGVGLLGLDGVTFVRAPAEASFEMSLGPTRLLSRAGVAWHVNHGGPGSGAFGIADEASAFAGVRLGRDVRYWAEVDAGGGPFIGVTYAKRGDVDFWGAALGLDLWGAN